MKLKFGSGSTAEKFNARCLVFPKWPNRCLKRNRAHIAVVATNDAKIPASPVSLGLPVWANPSDRVQESSMGREVMFDVSEFDIYVP